MVSLPGDVAPERFGGFYDQTAPAFDLMRRQYQDIPPRNFLQRQSGLAVGIPKPSQRLRNINGFMNASTNYTAVQNAPHYMKMRWQHVQRKNAARAADEIAKRDLAIHSMRTIAKGVDRIRKHKKRQEAYKSPAAGLKLKQAINQFIAGKDIPESELPMVASLPKSAKDVKKALSSIIQAEGVQQPRGFDLQALMAADAARQAAAR